MSESETDIEFVSDMEWLHSHDREAALPPEKLARLFALARRGADAADEIERLGRDYDTARDAHDRRVRELDAHCVEVARLRAEVERLRAALGEIAKPTYGYEPFMPDEEAKEYFKSRFFGAQAKARAALKEEGE